LSVKIVKVPADEKSTVGVTCLDQCQRIKQVFPKTIVVCGGLFWMVRGCSYEARKPPRELSGLQMDPEDFVVVAAFHVVQGLLFEMIIFGV